MEQDLLALRENSTRGTSSQSTRRDRRAVCRRRARIRGSKPPDLKTQLSGLLGVAALAQDPREVRAFLMYQVARKKEWGRLGEAILTELKDADKLPGVLDAGSGRERVMEAVRAYLGHVRRLDTYIQRANDAERAGRWQHVRDLAGDRAPQRDAQSGQRDQNRRR